MTATVFKVLVTDDEPHARERLCRLLEDQSEWQVVGEAGHGLEALELCERLQPDILLLDIRMPEMDGMEAARHLATLESGPAVIFTTAYDHYAIEAFEAHAVGYLLKPVRRERLIEALRHASRLGRASLRELARETDAAPRNSICVRQGDGLKLVPVDQVLSFQAEQKYVRMYHRKGEELLDESLKNLAAEFGERFIRIHRKALAATAYLDRLEKSHDGGHRIWLHHVAEPLPVSRRHIAAVRQWLKGRR